MGLKTVLETTEGLNEALIPFYTEHDDKFVLQIDGVREHPDVANLRVAYDREKEGAKALKAELADLKAKIANLPEDFDPEKWAKLKDGKADEAAQIKLRQEYEAKIEKLEGEVATVKEAARKTAIERDLTDALTAAGFTDPAVLDLARTKLAGEVRIGDDGKAVIETDMGPITPAERAKRLANGEWKALVTAPKGGGSKSGEGSGTVTKEQFASMGDKERVELFRADPETFKRLSAA